MNGDTAIRAILRAELREKKTQEMVDFRDGGYRRLSTSARHTLFDGDAGWQSFDGVHIGFFELVHELPGVGRHTVEKTALAFGEQNVKGERRFS